MQTVRQVERFWNSRQYDRLFRELIAFRPEASLAVQMETHSSAVAAAAMALIRLDELSQTHLPFCRSLLHCVIGCQEADGGWESPMLTSLCVRALMTCKGEGTAIDRGLMYLTNLQKPEGIWPRIPFRRLPADATASLFILYHLGNEPRFQEAVAFEEAVNWFHHNASQQDRATQKVWERIQLRCGLMQHKHRRGKQQGGQHAAAFVRDKSGRDKSGQDKSGRDDSCPRQEVLLLRESA